MTFTISQIAPSLAAYLADILPGVTFYEDPAQQGAITPCCFLQVRSSRIALRMSERWLWTLSLDLTYLEDYNLPDLQRRYEAAAEAVDYAMETFPYLDGSGASKTIRTYERQWEIDADALHYMFELRVWVKKPENETKMQSMTLIEEVTN